MRGAKIIAKATSGFNRKKTGAMAENDAHPATHADIIDDEHARTYRMFLNLMKYSAAGAAALLILLAILWG